MATSTDPAAPGATLTATLRRFRARYGLVLEWFVGALMVILFVEVTLGVVFRAIGHSLIWYDEMASVLLAWLTFYGSALASVKRAHIGCPELVDALPWPARRLMNIAAQVIVMSTTEPKGRKRGSWTVVKLEGPPGYEEEEQRKGPPTPVSGADADGVSDTLDLDMSGGPSPEYLDW